jgi:hypothetical protein
MKTNCQHEWKPRPNGIKEDCTKCGATRMVNPEHDRHYAPRQNLDVYDVKTKNKVV